MEQKNRFLILKKIKYSESDLIIHALSEKGTKFSFLAKSALKSKKRFGGGILEPLNFVLLTYETPKSDKMILLREASLLNDFVGLKRDYDRLSFALTALDAVGKVSQEGDDSSQFLFNLLGHVLQTLSDTQTSNWQTLEIQFILKFLMQQGVLNIEPWMKSYLKFQTSQFHLIEKDLHQDERISAVRNMLKAYVLNAHLDGN